MIRRVLGVLLILGLVMSLTIGCATEEKKATPPPAPAKPEWPKEIKVGFIFPLTGPNANDGMNCKKAIELAIDIVNNKYDLDLPFAKTEGIVSKGGAKIVPVWGDHTSNPEVAAAEAERLITKDKVVMLAGAGESASTATASQVGERYKIPMLAGNPSSPALNTRGFKYFFRTCPHDGFFSKLIFDFLDDYNKKEGNKVKTMVILHEDTVYGQDNGDQQQKLAQERGYKVLDRIRYNRNTSSLLAEVQRIKKADPDVVLCTNYTPDAILFFKSMEQLKWQPPMLVASGAGYDDPDFFKAIGAKANGLLNRNVFSMDFTKTTPALKTINELMLKKYNEPINGNNILDFQKVLVLADVLERAKSLSGDDLRQALVDTNIPREKLVLPWKAVKFDATGQNSGVTVIMVQWQTNDYKLVYPFDLNPASIIYPMPLSPRKK